MSNEIDEALNLMQEECAEIIQIISKIRRFGLNSYHPNDPEMRENRLLLNDEIGDFELLKRYLRDRGLIESELISERIQYKLPKLKKYTSLFDE
jgi:hypothetical protein